MAMQNGWNISAAIQDINFFTGQECSDGFQPRNDYYWLDNLECSGCEIELGSCFHNGFKSEVCGANQCIYLDCSGLNSINQHIRLDTTLIYIDGDEEEEICGDNFGIRDATVSCRQWAFQQGYDV